MYQRYNGGNMDEGWTRLLFEDFGQPYQSIFDPELKSGNLIAKYDVIVLPADNPGTLVGRAGGAGAGRGAAPVSAGAPGARGGGAPATTAAADPNRAAAECLGGQVAAPVGEGRWWWWPWRSDAARFRSGFVTRASG
jgi:hypothetical protein